MPDTKIFELSNKLETIYKEINGIGVVTVQIWVNTGLVNENNKNNGISHFIEHMVFNGTQKYKPNEIPIFIESKGALINAGTSNDFTYYYITLPSYQVEYAFDVLSEMIFRALFLHEELEKEKPAVLQEIKRKYNNPIYEMSQHIDTNLFKKTPYAMQIIGNKKNVLSFTRENLLTYYAHYYQPENMKLVIVGDLEYKKAQELSNRYFGDTVPYETDKNYKPILQQDLHKDITKNFYKDIMQEYALIAFKAPHLIGDEKYVLDILTEILSGGEYGLLNDRLKDKLEIVTSIFGGYSGCKDAGSFMFYYTCLPENDKTIIKEISLIIKSIKDGDINKEMLSRAKNRLASQIVFQREKCSSEAFDIGYSFTLGIKDYYIDYLEKINNVCIEDIATLSSDIFNKHYILSRTLPKNCADPK